MGNLMACGLISPFRAPPSVVKVVHKNGFVEEFPRVITAKELTIDYPDHFVYTHDLSFPNPLSEDSDLQLGRLYFLLPELKTFTDETLRALAAIASEATDYLPPLPSPATTTPTTTPPSTPPPPTTTTTASTYTSSSTSIPSSTPTTTSSICTTTPTPTSIPTLRPNPNPNPSSFPSSPTTTPTPTPTTTSSPSGPRVVGISKDIVAQMLVEVQMEMQMRQQKKQPGLLSMSQSCKSWRPKLETIEESNFVSPW